MKKIFVALGLLLALCSAASAQWFPMASGPTGAAPAYTGPGDIVASATAWYGLRAYNAAIVTTGTQALVNLRRSSDNHTCDIIVMASGGLGNTGNCSTGGENGTALGTWALRGSFTGTAASSTTMTTTGDSCVATAGDQVTWSGSSGYVTISSVTSCSAGVGSYVLSASKTFSAASVTDYIPTYVPTWYDQTGNGHNVTQATTASQPAFVFSCIGALPCLSNLAGSSVNLECAACLTPATGVGTLSTVAERWGSVSTGDLIRENSGNNRLSVVGSANTWETRTSSQTLTGTANDLAWHAANGVFNGASSILNIDGTETTGTLTGSTSTGNIVIVTTAGSGSYQSEAGIWDNTAFSSGQRTNMCHNQYTYWGTSTSC